MGFQDAVRICFQKYITISGRARRAEYWWWVLFLILGGIATSILDGFIFGFSEGSTQLLAALFSLGTLLPTICVAGRRLHDRDMSAWWLLLNIIPLLGSLILLFFYVTRGTPGPNRFGPDPLGPSGGTGRSPNVWDQPDDSFTRSSVPRAGQRE
jgi:uncharacterized membrane protein YhaH (DUF805 family)